MVRTLVWLVFVSLCFHLANAFWNPPYYLIETFCPANQANIKLTVVAQFSHEHVILSNYLYADRDNTIYVIDWWDRDVFIATETFSKSINYGYSNNFFIQKTKKMQMHRCSATGGFSYYINKSIAVCPASDVSPSTKPLCYPTGIFIDDINRVYVIDTSIRSLDERSAINRMIVWLECGFVVLKLLSLDAHIIYDSVNVLIPVPYLDMIINTRPFFCSCIAGCSPTNNRIRDPSRLWLDDYGNILVLDSGSSRVQKLQFNSNSSYFYQSLGLCDSASWNESATTLADAPIIRVNPRTIFIDKKDHLYTADYKGGRILVWDSWQMNPSRILKVPLYNYTDIFVDQKGDIYFEHGSELGLIHSWPMYSNQSFKVAKFPDHCFGLFIDLRNSLYCSLRESNKVMKVYLNQTGSQSILVAGNGRNGNSSAELHYPWGIFVDQRFNLYVADARNGRIQKFPDGRFTGQTIAGRNFPSGLRFNTPTDVYIDDKENIFVADDHHHRIIRITKHNRWTCISGCNQTKGEHANQLHNAIAIQFDSTGNLYVADENNLRIQKFELLTNHCDNQQTMTNTPVCHSTTQQHQEGYLTTSCSPINNKTNCTQSTTQCNKFTDFCSIIQPCLNGGTCVDNDQHPLWFFCVCPPLVLGDRCQYDQRACEPNPCHHDGTCTPTSSTSDQSKSDFMCACPKHWEGRRCETKVNYCVNVTCLNGGQCRPLVGGAVCECLKGSYSGRFCEIAARRVVVLRIASKSIGYVAVIALCSVALFVIVMDVLKYGFGIDPTREELEAIRREKREKKRRPVVKKFIYVNRPEDLTSV